MSCNTGFQQILLLSPAEFPIVLSVMNNPAQHMLSEPYPCPQSGSAGGNIVQLERDAVNVSSSLAMPPAQVNVFTSLTSPTRAKTHGLTTSYSHRSLKIYHPFVPFLWDPVYFLSILWNGSFKYILLALKDTNVNKDSTSPQEPSVLKVGDPNTQL